MRKFALLLALIMLLSSAAAAETLKVGMECDYPPYNWTQSQPSERAVALKVGGYADGYDVQMAKLIAAGLNMELEIVKTEWDGLPVGLQAGKIDVIIGGMSPTAERRMVIDFTDYYYKSDLVIVVLKDGPYASAKTLADLKGAKITGQLNTLHYDVIDQIEGVDKQTAMDTFPAMTVALVSRRIDGYVSERPGALSAMVSNPELSYVEFDEGEGFQVTLDDTSLAIGLKKGSPLVEPINQILAGISEEQRAQLMQDAVENQPLNQ